MKDKFNDDTYLEFIPKQKVKELVDKFDYPIGFGLSLDDKKQCALICVDEMLWFQEKMFGQDKESTSYLLEVKEEINKL